MAGNMTVLATLKRERKIEAFDNLFGSVISGVPTTKHQITLGYTQQKTGSRAGAVYWRLAGGSP